jgi:hypothetical protein
VTDTEVHVVWDDAAAKLFCEVDGGSVAHAMSRLADGLVLSMKYHCPVYTGPPRGPVPGHPRQVARRSGTLRSSIRKFRQPDGSYLIGPTDVTASGELLGPMIEDGTPPHDIDSTGPWPLYSAATNTYFGRHVHHPGTRPHPFIAPAAAELNGVTLLIT